MWSASIQRSHVQLVELEESSRTVDNGTAHVSSVPRNVPRNSFSARGHQLINSQNYCQKLKKILNPGGPHWNCFFLGVYLLSISLDSSFFYILSIDGHSECLALVKNLAFALVVFRSLFDIFHVIYVIFESDNADVDVPGNNSWAINARKYLHFINAILSILPIPLGFGALRYFIAIERVTVCWRQACKSSGCIHDSFLCDQYLGDRRILNSLCPIKIRDPTVFNFGMFHDALQTGIVEVRTNFHQKFLYCFQWGIRSLCERTRQHLRMMFMMISILNCIDASSAKNCGTSVYFSESLFSLVMTITGVALISSLFENVKYYYKEISAKMQMQEIEKCRLFQMLCDDLQQEVRNYHQTVRQATEDFNVYQFFNELPRGTNRKFKLQLCSPVLEKVFDRIDEHFLNAMLDLLKLVPYTERSILVHEGSGVEKMFFIVRGKIWSEPTTIRTTTFSFNASNDGHFCGEELLPRASVLQLGGLPISTRTVIAHTPVEAFVIEADDWKQLVNSFMLPDDQLPYIFSDLASSKKLSSSAVLISCKFYLLLPFIAYCSLVSSLSMSGEGTGRDEAESRSQINQRSSISSPVKIYEMGGIVKLLELSDKSCLLKALVNWNKIIVHLQGNSGSSIQLFLSMAAVSIDPLFFYIPVVNDNKKCIRLDYKLAVTATGLRSLFDFLYIFYITPQLLADLVASVNAKHEANNSLKSLMKFWLGSLFVDLPAVFPLPQVFGALWYFSAIERQTECWKKACLFNNTGCTRGSFDCYDSLGNYEFLNEFCPTKPQNTTILDFGIFQHALQSGIVEVPDFPQKFLHCFRWGLRNLSCFGQNLQTSSNAWENFFVILVTISGLVLMLFLIGNIQIYLQTKATRPKEMTLRMQEMNEHMPIQKLSRSVQQQLKIYQRYIWRKPDTIDVESSLSILPKELRRNIKRELCLDLLKNVKEFKTLDEEVLDALCDCVKPAFYFKHTHIVLEGDPIYEMLFIVQGKMWIYTSKERTNGSANTSHSRDNSKFISRKDHLADGDFWGEELVAWVLRERSLSNIPMSTRSVQALTNVEAFGLMAHDLKHVFIEHQVASSTEFNSNYSVKDAARIIQLAWRRRYSSRNLLKSVL
ncbi:hypothetical protein WN943_028141 [Citrus x changshan-huyou]